MARDQELVGLKLWLDQETDPKKRAELFVLISRRLRGIGLFLGAKAILEAGLQDYPEDALLQRSLGLERFRSGDIAGGLALYDKGRWRLESFDKYKRPFSAPFWQGEDLRGKRLLIWAEQGIGDQIMQARVLTPLLKTGAHITLEADARLHNVLRHKEQVTCFQQFTKPDPALTRQDFDFQTSMLSAWRFLPDPLGHAGALVAPKPLTQQYSAAWAKMGAAKNIGVSWHSRAKATGEERGLDLALLRPLSQKAGLRWHSLQYGAPDLRAASNALGAPLLSDPQCDPLKDLRRQAAQIAALDLVITIDNATAHIAGALGTPCWVLLPKASEWRWGTPEKPNVLYPNLRTFRADAVGDWSAALWDIFDAFQTEFGSTAG